MCIRDRLYLEQAKEIIYNEDTPLQTEMGDAATELDTFLEKSMAEERTRIENSVKGTFFAIIAAMVAATIGVLVLAFALIRNVTGPTEEMCIRDRQGGQAPKGRGEVLPWRAAPRPALPPACRRKEDSAHGPF